MLPALLCAVSMASAAGNNSEEVSEDSDVEYLPEKPQEPLTSDCCGTGKCMQTDIRACSSLPNRLYSLCNGSVPGRDGKMVKA